MLQPTMSSFLSLRSGFKGSGGQRTQQITTSDVSNQEVTGQGPPTGPTTGNLKIFGEGERKPRTLLKGSPEHNLLKEAQVLEIGESHSQGQPKEGRGFSGSQARKLIRWT